MANEKNLKNFQKGNKAAVGHGRPKGSKSLTTILREAMTKEVPAYDEETGCVQNKQVSELIIASLIKNAVEGDIRHAREILDRLDGKPIQNIESHTKLDMSSINLSSLSYEQIDQILKDNKDE